jgi:NDP-sugar pyrophosphorylase family protein
MRAIIIAGGKGRRLKPYTTAIPKPLVPIGNKFTILEIILIQLANQGFNHITLAVNHMGKLMESFFGNGKKFGIKIDYSYEKNELGTIAPLRNIKKIPDNFLVMNSDILTNINFELLLKYHSSNNNLTTITTSNINMKSEFGVVNLKNNKILNFQEKPLIKQNVCIGVNCFNKKILNYIPKNYKFSFDDLLLQLIKKKKTINNFSFNGFWLDMGRPEDYDKVNNEFSKLSKKLNIDKLLKKYEQN